MNEPQRTGGSIKQNFSQQQPHEKVVPFGMGSICWDLPPPAPLFLASLSAGHIFIELLIGCHIISLVTTKSDTPKGRQCETETRKAVGARGGEWTLALARMKVKDVNDNVRPCRSQRLMRFSQSVRPFICVRVCGCVCARVEFRLKDSPLRCKQTYLWRRFKISEEANWGDFR